VTILDKPRKHSTDAALIVYIPGVISNKIKIMPVSKKINRALIVDDEPDLCELAEITLSRMGLETHSANSLSDALALLKSEPFDLCITDMNLPDGDGIDLVSHIQTHLPEIPVAVITAYGNMELAIRALKAGAFDFVSKPVDLQILRRLVTSAINLPGTDNNTPQSSESKYSLLGESALIQDLRKQIGKLARSQAPVFINGESGCGKELAAHLMHDQGARASQPFIPVNCGAIPGELVESEFFGHIKGSFTGATSDKEGLFKAADGGTLFLDEVADLPMQMQVKLLRAIQEKSIRPVGGHHEDTVDVRILSASHKNLADLVKQGEFREDLFYRINVIELQIPSLRARAEDIPLLANHLLHRLCEKNRTFPPSFSAQAINALENYHFPGNVRELENILERALALSEGDNIALDDLQLPQKQTQKQNPDLPEAASAPAKHTPSAEITHNTLREQERSSIMQALEQTRWNKTAAAKLLGLSLRQLRYRLSKLNIE